MQKVTESWEQTNRDNFTRPANVTLSLTLADGTEPIVSGTRLISFNYNKSGDCLSSVLTQDTITFTFDNADGRFSYDPENDIYQFSKVVVNCGFMNATYDAYDGIRGGTYFISNTEAFGGKTTFTAKTIIGFMQAKWSAGETTDTGYNIAVAALAQAGDDKGVPLDSIAYDFDDCLKDYQLSISSTDGYSMAEVLQLVANAFGCVLYVDRLGKVCIKKLGDISENYVLSGKISYEFPKVKLAEKIGVIHFYYNHGQGHASNVGSARKAGGTQTVKNPIVISDFHALEITRNIFDFRQDNRKKITGNFRADPRIDLFDIIVVPANGKACVCAVTKINFTFNGAWRGTFEVNEIKNAVLSLRICDLEMLTLEQLESIPIEYLHPNTVSDVEGDYIASEDGELMLWEGI